MCGGPWELGVRGPRLSEEAGMVREVWVEILATDARRYSKVGWEHLGRVWVLRGERAGFGSSLPVRSGPCPLHPGCAFCPFPSLRCTLCASSVSTMAWTSGFHT